MPSFTVVDECSEGFLRRDVTALHVYEQRLSSRHCPLFAASPLTQFIVGGDDVRRSGLEVGSHDAQRVQPSHVTTPDLQYTSCWWRTEGKQKR